METLVAGCQSCPAKHVLLILDCCYSGYALMRGYETKTEKNTNFYLKDKTSRRAIQVLAAGQEDQPVSDSGIRHGYSAFTGALLDILETEKVPDDDSILTADGIGSKLERRIPLHEVGIHQRPAYGHISGSKGGDFVFRVLNAVN